MSGAAGYVSFCQGAPDNVLDGILDAFLIYDCMYSQVAGRDKQILMTHHLRGHH